MKTFTLIVTEEHLRLAENVANQSQHNDSSICTTCVVAQAVKQQFPKSIVNVGYTRVHLNHKLFVCDVPDNMEQITHKSYGSDLRRGITRRKLESLLPITLNFIKQNE